LKTDNTPNYGVITGPFPFASRDVHLATFHLIMKVVRPNAASKRSKRRISFNLVQDSHGNM